MTIDCDIVAHELYADKESILTKRLCEAFGRDKILDENECIDRKKLGKEVFGNEPKRQMLNNIVWPAVHEQVLKIIETVPIEKKCVFVEAALLLDANWGKELCKDGIWVCYCPPDVAIERMLERNHYSREEAEKRLYSQRNPDDLIKEATLVINTNRPRPEVVEFIKDCYQKLIDGTLQ